jgi:hypothetical protein
VKTSQKIYKAGAAAPRLKGETAIGYDKETEKSIYCDICPLWRDDMGCLHRGLGLVVELEGDEEVLGCNTKADDPELLEMYKGQIVYPYGKLDFFGSQRA